MKILGIDPGTTRTGWGVIEKNKGLHLIDCGLISGEGVDIGNRLAHLEEEVERLIYLHQPDMVCLEKLFFSNNQKTASAVSEARGVVILTVQKAGFKLLEFTPSEIKSTVAGDGRADKEGVRRAVEWTLGADSIPGPDDVSDALAIALRGAFEPS
ncbi:MAG: crossover junction endodeoxyribonuclease RuvC [bacterium]|nr:crossover junction endodeoxyribonuclease RuvC [bacterium]MDZ4231248.1 crossover junction endodeoxyribonuclease RuvC [Patescibacteria group bacterium]